MYKHNASVPLTMARLTDVQRAELALRLQSRRQALQAELESERHLSRHDEETDDEAVVDLEQAVDVAALERDSNELSDVEAALARMEGADFGICTDCKAPIAYARLQVNPAASRCATCQASAERAAGADHPARL